MGCRLHLWVLGSACRLWGAPVGFRERTRAVWTTHGPEHIPCCWDHMRGCGEHAQGHREKTLGCSSTRRAGGSTHRGVNSCCRGQTLVAGSTEGAVGSPLVALRLVLFGGGVGVSRWYHAQGPSDPQTMFAPLTRRPPVSPADVWLQPSHKTCPTQPPVGPGDMRVLLSLVTVTAGRAEPSPTTLQWRISQTHRSCWAEPARKPVRAPQTWPHCPPREPAAAPCKLHVHTPPESLRGCPQLLL